MVRVRGGQRVVPAHRVRPDDFVLCGDGWRTVLRVEPMFKTRPHRGGLYGALQNTAAVVRVVTRTPVEHTVTPTGDNPCPPITWRDEVQLFWPGQPVRVARERRFNRDRIAQRAARSGVWRERQPELGQRRGRCPVGGGW